MKYIILFVSFLGLASCSFWNNFGGDYTKKPTINNNTGAIQTSSGKIFDDDSGSGSKEDMELKDIQKDIDAIFSDIENGGK